MDLQGKQTQDVREDVVKRFRDGEYEMLIASNVASRGLGFPEISQRCNKPPTKG